MAQTQILWLSGGLHKDGTIMAIRQLTHIAALDVFDVRVVVFKIMEDKPINAGNVCQELPGH